VMFAERTNPAAGVTARDKWKERSEFPLICPRYAKSRSECGATIVRSTAPKRTSDLRERGLKKIIVN